MSEKYTFECDGNNCQIFENDVWLKIEEVVDLLNTLHEENITLKERRDDFAEENLVLTLSLNKLKKEKESWKNIACQDLSKWSIFSNEVSVLHETRNVDRFLENYYKYCADMVMNDE